MKYFLLLFFIIFCFGNAMTQTPFFTHRQIQEPFQNTKINTIFEASQGYIWLGTDAGLFRYDGMRFEFLESHDSIQTGAVTAIFEDQSGRLWVGCKDGKIFHLIGKKLRQWLPEEGTPAVKIVGFEEDGNGLLWFATYGEGIYFLNENRLYNVNADDGLLGDDIYEMEVDDDGKIWVGTDGGINICSFENGKKQIISVTRNEGLPDEIVRTILKDEQGNFWIGMHDGGLAFFDFQKKKIEVITTNWNYGPINELEFFENRELWIGTDGAGVFRYDFSAKTIRKISSKFFEKTKIYDLHKDAEGNIWVVTNKGGIHSGSRLFELVDTQIQDIQALRVSSNDYPWIGTQTGLFTYRQNESGESIFEKKLGHLDLNVLSLAEDAFGNLWIGTYGQGLYCWNPISKKLKHFTEKNGLINDNITSISGSKDRMWLATFGGVTAVEISRDILETPNPAFWNFDEKNGLETGYIYKVFIDSKGRAWFGTAKNGISIFENGNFTNYSKVGDTALRDVFSITEDHRGHIWLSTGEEGLFKFDGEKFFQLTMKEGMRNLEITSLITDAKGNILIVHPSGIDLLDPVTGHLTYYDSEIGIEGLEPNLNTVCTRDQRNIWIGFQNQLFRYAALDEALRVHPKIQLEEVSVMLEPVDFQRVMSFSARQNNVAFDFIGLWYTDPSTLKYRYKLEGYDDDWVVTNDTRATYQNLRNGTYTFSVSSTENDAFDDEPIVSYQFKIRKPFWSEWWFLIGSFIIFWGLISWFVKWRERRLQREADLKKEKIENQLLVLKSQINPHFLFNSFNTLVAIIEENPRIAVEYVERLSDFYRSILQFREKDVIPLQEELELVNNYVFLLKKRYGENLKLQIHLNGERALVVPMTFQMLVENAVKHNVISKNKPLTISISKENESYFSITNNLQRKFTKEPSTGFGIQSIQSRYGLIHQSPVVIEDNGTTFKVLIPNVKINHV